MFIGRGGYRPFAVGSELKFIVSNGEIYHKKRKLFGGVSKGSVALQDCGDGTFRITFCDLKNIAIAAGKTMFTIGKNIYDPSVKSLLEYLESNSLCAFTFTKADLKSKNVVIKYQIQIGGFSVYAGLMCYDMRTHLGCSYLFDSDGEVRKWAKEIGIESVEYLDANGKVEEIEPI